MDRAFAQSMTSGSIHDIRSRVFGGAEANDRVDTCDCGLVFDQERLNSVHCEPSASYVLLEEVKANSYR